MSIQAAYVDICEACGGQIRPGQLIDRDMWSEKWMHETCPQDEPRPVCPECFTEIALSGACAC